MGKKRKPSAISVLSVSHCSGVAYNYVIRTHVHIPTARALRKAQIRQPSSDPPSSRPSSLVSALHGGHQEGNDAKAQDQALQEGSRGVGFKVSRNFRSKKTPWPTSKASGRSSEAFLHISSSLTVYDAETCGRRARQVRYSNDRKRCDSTVGQRKGKLLSILASVISNSLSEGRRKRTEVETGSSKENVGLPGIEFVLCVSILVY